MPTYNEWKEIQGARWGRVPSHWDVRSLRHAARLQYGSSLPVSDRNKGKVPVFGSNGQVDTHDQAITTAPLIVVGRKGSVGEIKYSSLPGYPIDTTYFIDSRSSNENLRWLYYCLLSQRLEELSEHSAVPGLSREYVYSIPVAVPPHQEQRAIADFLDQCTNKIDRLIAKKERLIELLEERRTALITKAVTKGLDPDVPMKDSGVEWLGEIPEHWDVRELKHCTDPEVPISYGILKPGPDVTHGVPYLGAGEVGEGKLDPNHLPKTSPEIAASYPRTCLREGELVYAIRGSFGAVAIVPEALEGANLSRDAARIAPGRNIAPKWLCFALRSEVVQTQFEVVATGAAVTGVNIGDLREVWLPVPPGREQEAIAQYVDDEVNRLHKGKQLVTEAIERLREYRSALITAAVTGKIDVRDHAA